LQSHDTASTGFARSIARTFHHWLVPQEFGKRFGPADQDIQAVNDWLTSEGFQVNRIAAGRMVIEFSGPPCCANWERFSARDLVELTFAPGLSKL